MRAQTPKKQGFTAGFTLVEMLVVMGVIGVLMGLLMPVLSRIKAESKSTLCLTNLRQLFTAVETARQQKQDLLPYAAPLPPPIEAAPFIPGLPDRLAAIIPKESDTWMCPADDSQDSEDLGTSYFYSPGAWMIPDLGYIPPPPELPLSPSALIDRATRLTTQRYVNGFLRHFPLISDNDDYHVIGSRQPRNSVFIDGNARVSKPGDLDVFIPPDR